MSVAYANNRYIPESIYSSREKLLFGDRPCQIAAATPIVCLDRRQVLSVDVRRDAMRALLPLSICSNGATAAPHGVIMKRFSLTASLCIALLMSPASQAQAPQPSGYHYTLPLDVALDAAKEAIRVCETKHYWVTATVLDMDGVPQVVL